MAGVGVGGAKNSYRSFPPHNFPICRKVSPFPLLFNRHWYQFKVSKLLSYILVGIRISSIISTLCTS